MSINDNGDRSADYALLDMDPDTGIFDVSRLSLSFLRLIFPILIFRSPSSFIEELLIRLIWFLMPQYIGLEDLLHLQTHLLADLMDLSAKQTTVSILISENQKFSSQLIM